MEYQSTSNLVRLKNPNVQQESMEQLCPHLIQISVEPCTIYTRNLMTFFTKPHFTRPIVFGKVDKYYSKKKYNKKTNKNVNICFISMPIAKTTGNQKDV